jgi:hypothetical protein
MENPRPQGSWRRAADQPELPGSHEAVHAIADAPTKLKPITFPRLTIPPRAMGASVNRVRLRACRSGIHTWVKEWKHKAGYGLIRRAYAILSSWSHPVGLTSNLQKAQEVGVYPSLEECPTRGSARARGPVQRSPAQLERGDYEYGLNCDDGRAHGGVKVCKKTER